MYRKSEVTHDAVGELCGPALCALSPRPDSARALFAGGDATEVDATFLAQSPPELARTGTPASIPTMGFAVSEASR